MNETPAIESQKKANSKKISTWKRILKSFFFFSLLSIIIGIIIAAIAIAMAYPKLPSITTLKNYKPQIAMQVFTEDGQLIGQFGTERRKPVAFKDIPNHLKNAILAIEDARFYEHNGVDYYGLTRATINNIVNPGDLQGASTITQQLAKNFFLSPEKTITRKFYEALMAKKIEANMGKDEILERYINFIYLGERAYGFAAAADVYFDKELKDLTIAESAMLATLPQAPGRNNPIRSRTNSDLRQKYVLQRMFELNYITPSEYSSAQAETVRVVDTKSTKTKGAYKVHAEYVAEMARQLMFDKYKEAAYTEGLKIYTTINSLEQEAAYSGVRSAVMNYDQKYGYRGPEKTYSLPNNENERIQAFDDIFDKHPDQGDLRAAIVTEVSSGNLKVMLSDTQPITITGSSMAYAKNGRIKVGSVIRVIESSNDSSWRISQIPAVQASFVSMSAEDGAIRSLVGGFDFNLSEFNHITQGWRQPGSGIKPFIYSAAMEKNGLTPNSIVNDSPIQIGSWKPKNSDGRYLGSISLYRALASSRNMVSIRLLQSIGNDYFREYANRFGFDAKRINQYLTVSLGATEVTSWQMAGAYAVFANGGYKLNPYIISKVLDRNGNTILLAQPRKARNEAYRVISAKNAAMSNSLMRGAVQYGTARGASVLGRSDVAGKTGTTNDSKDAWFNGYNPKIVGIAWMGFDHPKSLGSGEFGGTLSLPIWVNYMRVALNKQKIETFPIDDFSSTLSAAPKFETENGIPSNTPPENLKVDAKSIPPSNNEARKESENINLQDAEEAAKVKPQPKLEADTEKDPLAPFTPQPIN